MSDKGKQIDINASSLVDLKAELLRKQEEFRQQKLQNATHRSLSVPKKPNVWSKKNAGVLERAQNDLEQKTEEADVIDRARSALEAKARLYEQMSQSDTISEEDGSKHFLVDFEQKTLTSQAERRRMQQQKSEVDTADQPILDKDDKELASEKQDEDVPSNPDEQWIDYVDSFGRSRRCLRKDLADMMGTKQKAPSDTKDAELMSADMKRELQRQQWELEAEEALSRPAGPVHYADIRYNEIRDHGVGFFEFSKDEETRQQQLEALKKLRQQTDEQRARSDAVKEKRKALLEARLAKVRQRKTVQAVPDLDVDVTAANDNASEVGPELPAATKAPIEPEPLVRDESLRKTGSIREWDKGKTPVYDEESWLTARRDERLSDFAPPQIYAADSVHMPPRPRPPPHPQQHRSMLRANQRPQKRPPFGSKPRQQFHAASRIGASPSAENVAAVLQSIRSTVEQHQVASSHNHDDKTAVPSRNSDTAHNSSVDFTTAPSCYTADAVSIVHDGGGVLYPVNLTTTSSLSIDRFFSTGSTVQEPSCGTLPSSSSSICDKSADYTASVTSAEAEVTTDSSGPQPAHYSSAPSAPQAKMPKYERVFLHHLPPTLPLPPVAGSSNTQYPSQEEVIGPKRRKEPQEMTEKYALRNWHRQFDQKRTKPVVSTTSEDSVKSDDKSQLLKPKNIPFASPYIQTNATSSDVMDDAAAKEFDPSKPPPSVGNKST